MQLISRRYILENKINAVPRTFTAIDDSISRMASLLDSRSARILTAIFHELHDYI